MGKLSTKYDKSTDVEAALDKGVSAYKDITKIKENSISKYNVLPFSADECTLESIGANGEITSQTKRMLSPKFMLPKNFRISFYPSVAHVAIYNADGSFARRLENTSDVKATEDTYIRFSVRKTDNTEFVGDDKQIMLETISLKFETSYIDTDNTHTYQGEKITIGNRCVKKALGFTGAEQGSCIHGKYMLSFTNVGHCKVIDIEAKKTVSEFDLNKASTITPHCNTAVFGCDKYADSDKFPLLYVNAYNNENLPKGTVYVHRIITDSNGIPQSTSLIQTITVGFTADSIWESGSDIRPYGNFFVDTDNRHLYAYTLRDTDNVTRFFKFALPDYKTASVTLSKSDIIDHFDIDYLPYIQDNMYDCGKAYILNGMPWVSGVESSLTVVSLSEKQIVSKLLFKTAFGAEIEPEFIDRYGDNLIIGDSQAYSFSF